jgi:hypothetical protein
MAPNREASTSDRGPSLSADPIAEPQRMSVSLGRTPQAWLEQVQRPVVPGFADGHVCSAYM